MWFDYRRGVRSLGLMLGILIIGSTGCDLPTEGDGVEGEEVASSSDLLSVVAALTDGSTMSSVLAASALTSTLRGEGPYTMLIPANSAFDRLPAGMVDELKKPGNAEVLGSLLGLHVIPGRLKLSDFRDGQRLTTLRGLPLAVSVQNGLVSIEGISIRTADLEASNGTVHVVNGVFTNSLNAAQLLSVMPNVSRFRTAMSADEAGAALSRDALVTVFAPTNAAFDKLDAGFSEHLFSTRHADLLTKVLRYHLIGGRLETTAMQENTHVATLEGSTVHVRVRGGRKINWANLVVTDIRVSNGVIHIVDTVLKDHLHLLDVAELSGFETFVDVVESLDNAGLNSALKAGALTLFAPSNETFAVARDGVAGNRDALQALVNNHLAWGWLDESTLRSSGKFTTLNGDEFVLTTGSDLRISNGATQAALGPAILSKNGVLYSASSVLAPAR